MSTDTDIAVCPDCAPGKPCEAHLMALAELVARANAPDTGSFDFAALHAMLNRGESLDRDTSHALLWRVKSLEQENERLLKRLDRLYEQMEVST